VNIGIYIKSRSKHKNVHFVQVYHNLDLSDGALIQYKWHHTCNHLQFESIGWTVPRWWF